MSFKFGFILKKITDDSYPNHINPSWWHSFHRFKVQTTNLVFFFGYVATTRNKCKGTTQRLKWAKYTKLSKNT